MPKKKPSDSMNVNLRRSCSIDAFRNNIRTLEKAGLGKLNAIARAYSVLAFSCERVYQQAGVNFPDGARMESNAKGSSLRALNAALTQVAALLEWEPEDVDVPGATQLRDDTVTALNRMLPAILQQAVVHDQADAPIGHATLYTISPMFGAEIAARVAQIVKSDIAFDLNVLRAGFYLIGLTANKKVPNWKIGKNLRVVDDDHHARIAWTRIRKTFGLPPKQVIP